jgi:threonylcarbamoyladenosine tRNA methylthiotransferase MtaB
MIRFATITLGCKVNHYETEKLERRLMADGMELVYKQKDVEFIVINTCSVTHRAEKKSRHLTRKTIKENPDAQVYVTGCALTTDLQSIRDIVGSNFIFVDKEQLFRHLRQTYMPDRVSEEIRETGNPFNFARGFLMIENGCENYCAYCIIPYIRGNVQSKSFEEAVTEAKAFLGRGIKEIVLTGINLGMYYDRKNNRSLTDVCRAILRLDDSLRLRLSSIEPNLVEDTLIELMEEEPRFCNHLHIPLQGGDDSVLNDMNRKYGTAEYRALVEKLYARIPGLSVTTDLVVGFPTEKQEHFENTLAFIEACRFSKIHLFPYSKREGTAAAGLTLQYSPDELKKRMETAGKLERQMRENFHQSLIGTTQQVLVEQTRENIPWGYTTNYIRVQLESKHRINQIVEVIITGQTEDGLCAI